MNKHIFIHNPKTGGYTIRKQAGIVSYVHDTALKVKSYVPDYGDCFTFGFVRNPYDRFLSAYMFYKQMGPDHMFWRLEADKLTARAVGEYSTFQNFVKGFSEFKYKNRIHFLPQHHWFYAGDVCLVDYYGFFEKYDDCWRTICGYIDRPYQPLPRLNTSSHTFWQTYYDNVTRAIVYELYEQDFRLFPYNY